MTFEDLAFHVRTQQETSLSLALASPFVLTLSRDAYSPAKKNELAGVVGLADPNDIIKQLISLFLSKSVANEGGERRSVERLAWIASKMGDSRELWWWDIARWACSDYFKVPYSLLTSLATGWLVGLTVVLILAWWIPIAGFLIGAAFGLATFGVSLRTLLTQKSTGPLDNDAPLIRRRLGTPIQGIKVAIMTLSGSAAGWLSWLFAGKWLGATAATVTFVAILRFVRLPLAAVVTPLTSYRNDRVGAIVVALLWSSLSYLWSAVIYGPLVGLLVGLSVGVAIQPFVSHSGRLAFVEVCFYVFRRERVSIIRLLTSAADRRVLWEAGAAFQFRHSGLQHYLAAQDRQPVVALAEPSVPGGDVVADPKH
jgi:hypothetical protein